MLMKNLVSLRKARKNQNARNAKQKIPLSLGILAVVIIFISAGLFFAQNKNTQNTSDKADQNLKSMARVNPVSLAMEFSLPLGNYPGRAGNSQPVALNYSSKVWTTEMTNYRRESYALSQGQPDYATHEVLEATDVTPKFSEKSVAGWTSSLAAPEIRDRDVFNQDGAIYRSSFLPPSNFSPDDWDYCESGGIEYRLDESCPSGIRLVRVWVCRNHGIEDWEETYTEQLGCDPYYLPPPPSWPSPSPLPTTTPPPPPQMPTPMPQVPHSVNRVTITMPGGASHEFRADDQVCNYATGTGCVDPASSYLSVDGTGMRFEPGVEQPNEQVRSVLHMPNGDRYIFPAPINGQVHGTAEKFIDRNGNISTFNETTRTWTDTMGRSIVDPLPRPGAFPAVTASPQTYNIKGISNANVPYVLDWQHMEDVLESGNPTDLKPMGRDKCTNVVPQLVTDDVLFENEDLPNDGVEVDNNLIRYKRQIRTCADTYQDNPVDFNGIVLAGVTLPDGSKYDFKYNEYGEISKITYPSGGYERFEYARITPMGFTSLDVYAQANRGVVKRFVSIDGTTEQQEWTYSEFSDPNGYALRTTAPDGSKSERVLYNSQSYGFGFDDPRAGMVKEERVKDTNGAVRSRTLNEWTVVGPQGTGAYEHAARDARPTRSISINIEGTSALATMTETLYETPGENGSTAPTDLKYFARNNAITTKAYHYLPISLSHAQNASLEEIKGQFAASGQVAKHTKVIYQYDENYMKRGIPSLPVETQVLNPSNGQVLSQAQTVYDESAYRVADSPALTGNGIDTGTAANTWLDPASDTTIPANSAAKRGAPTTVRTWYAEESRWLSAYTQYDQYGNVRKVWDVSGLSDKYAETEYSANYHSAYPTKVTSPAPAASSNNHVTHEKSQGTSTYDLRTGLPLAVTDDFGQITTTEYDSIMRPIRVHPVVVNGVATGPVTETIYNPPNQTTGKYDLNTWRVKVRKQLDANNWDESETHIDGLGRTKKTVARDSQGDVIVETKYDLMGRPYLVTNPYRAGDPVFWNRTKYDALGRAVQSFAPAEAGVAQAEPLSSSLVSLGTTSFSVSAEPNYVGTVVTSDDASGRKSRSITNALGQLLRVDEPTSMGGTAEADLGAIGSPVQPTSYKYDPYGNMVKVSQGGANGQKRYFKYDSLGRLIRVNQPEQETNPNIWATDSDNTSGQWTAAFTYDDLGNVLTAVDARHVTVANTYDRLGRVLVRAYYGENTANLTPPVYFFYDGKGLASQQTPVNYAKGKLTAVSNGISETRYKLFDNFGRLKEMEQRTPVDHTVETPGQTTPRISKYTYNLSGALIEEEYPSGRKVKNEFESDGDLKRVFGNATSTADEQTYVNSFSYTASGGISQMKLGNGKWETAQLNSRDQVTQLGLGNSATDKSLWKTDYYYGELNPTDGSVNSSKNTGKIAKQTLTLPGTTFTQSYRYDALYRLTEAKEWTGTNNSNPNWTQTFGYDLYGNRTSFTQNIGEVQTNTTPAVSAYTNRITSTNFTYDKNGNIIGDIDPIASPPAARSFVFNADNKQVEVKNASNIPIGKYYYDGEGKRVKKVTDTETTIFVYSNGNLVAEYSTQLSTNPTIAYPALDHLGSPRIITDKFGNVKSRRDFMPFGEDIYVGVGGRTGDSGQKYASNQDDVRQKFTGYQKDSETSLDFAEARMYENRYGRFTAVDPLLASGKSSNPQSFNRYVYTLNSPLNYIDPSGMAPDDWYVRDDGNIEVYKTNDSFDRFYVWSTANKGYINKGVLQKSADGLVEFPQSGYGFTSYNSFENGAYVEPGGYDKVKKEQTGVGDHWVKPIVAAALFGLTNQLKNDYGVTIAFGDMSSSNGSDPWNPNDLFGRNNGHHGGHGHNGDRSGLDIDYRYVDSNGDSQKGDFTAKSAFDLKKNQGIYTLGTKWGFTSNYTGPNTPIKGVPRIPGHDNHGHLGFGNVKATELRYDRRSLRPGEGLPAADRIFIY